MLPSVPIYRDVPNLDNGTMKIMTPQCYFAHYEGVDEIPKAPIHLCAMMCAMMPHNKPEKGILILEDISMTDSKFKHLDKNKIPDIEDFLVVMEALAHFHGIWWQVLRDLRGINLLQLAHGSFKPRIGQRRFYPQIMPVCI